MELSSCCQAAVTYDGDGNLYCKKCYGPVEANTAPAAAVVQLPTLSIRVRYEVHCINDGVVYASQFDPEKAQQIADRLASEDGRVYLVEKV